MKKLPLGIQTFSDIRDPKENFVYVDKTNTALELINTYRYCFLSRPRRFGKSLFLDTLSEIFKGNKQLFEELYIHDKWNWEQKFPVIFISFAVGDFSSRNGVESRIKAILKYNSLELAIDIDDSNDYNSGDLLGSFIYNTYKKYNQKVVILIDEYDKPILDNVHRDDKQPAIDARNILRDFYSAIKASDAYVKFVFITGVSKFSKLNLFSGLNNLYDITLDKKYATITGYTHADLLASFGEWFEGADMEKVRQWYNGYNYLGEPVYNPFDILLFLSRDKQYSNYWWETGNPAFLIEILKKKPQFIPELENIIVDEAVLNAFDVEYIDMAALLWQTGYLTFESKSTLMNMTSYKMKVPNLEIQASLNTLFLDYLINIKNGLRSKQIPALQALLNNDIESLIANLKSLFASIPYNNYVNNTIGSYEGYYASVVFTYLASLGVDIIAEDTTNTGRIDLTLKTPSTIYIFEFKVDVPKEAAIKQALEKRYHEKYTAENKSIIIVGIHFDSEAKNIGEFEWREVQ